MDFDMKKDTNFNEEIISVPSFLPRLFVAPSCLPKFSTILATVADMKTLILKKTIELQEARSKKEYEIIDKLNAECLWLCLKMDALECEAKEMRKELVERIYVEVRSVREMKAVNELRFGTGAGATPGMRCFKGMVYVSLDTPKEVMKAMEIAQRLGKRFD